MLVALAAIVAVGCGSNLTADRVDNGEGSGAVAATTTEPPIPEGTFDPDRPQPPPTDSPPATEPAATVPVNDPAMTLAEFEQIAAGMSYEQVVAIVGGEGELVSQADFGGITTALYSWEGSGGFGANANVTFQNNAEVGKAQFGLS